MKVEYYGEFTYDLTSVAPYTYWLHKQGKLTETAGPPGSGPIYYFSPRHEIKGGRSITSPKKNIYPDIVTYPEIYRSDINRSKWIPPPYKKRFKNKKFVYKKPLFIINNKYRDEWSRGPVNFFDIKFLQTVFDILLPDYQVMYIRARGTERGYSSDGADFPPFNDYELIYNNYPKVMTMEDILQKYRNEKAPLSDYNLFQFMLHANCDKFLSISGGNSVLSSYFGGTNIVYEKMGNLELCHQGYFKRFAGTDIHFYRTYPKVIQCLRSILSRK
jgi:hypothetical protein